MNQGESLDSKIIGWFSIAFFVWLFFYPIYLSAAERWRWKRGLPSYREGPDGKVPVYKESVSIKRPANFLDDIGDELPIMAFFGLGASAVILSQIRWAILLPLPAAIIVWFLGAVAFWVIYRLIAYLVIAVVEKWL
jgi:hypothetical protein